MSKDTAVGNSPIVYILRCADGSYYVRVTRDVAERVTAHNDGRGAAYTYKRRPVELVCWEPQPSEAEAVARERQLKGWSRAKKEALIDGNARRLRALSRSREHLAKGRSPASQ